MNGIEGYAVFFFPQALEALGGAVKPYLVDGPDPYVLCKEIDTGGALIEMTLQGRTPDGRDVTIELMVPGSMVRMIVSARSDGAFGFGVRPAAPAPAPAPASVPSDTPSAPSTSPASSPENPPATPPATPPPTA